MSERASTKGRDEITDGFRNLIWVEGEVAYIQLTQGEVTTIDAADLSRLAGRHVSVRKNLPNKYAAVHLGRGRFVPLHRFLINPPSDRCVDHIDGDGLNNRRANLRLATNCQNLWNTGPWSSNTSGHKGVSWRADRRKWQVHIRVGGKRLSLGHYTDVKMAAAAYAEAARKYHGEFANIGKPEEAANAASNPLSEGRERS